MLMWWMLLAIIGCYAFAALAVRAAVRRHRVRRAGTHVVLLAGNQGGRIEWYLRRLRRWSLRTGRDVRVTLVDCGSTDDTVAIAERFGRRTGAVSVVRPGWLAATPERRERPELNGIEIGRDGAVRCGNDRARIPGDLPNEDEVQLPEELLLFDLSNPEDVARLP
ncbi:MAG: hypothetical protein A9Z00_11990 [Thermobacillus sp. ZCTH02-B1]|nr:MAG: hypothetical protein A9Z00_11990 [Thermobacillus sp. ZCTH02-B1]